MPAPLLEVKTSEHRLTLVKGGRVVATAVVTGWGWHISLGRRRLAGDYLRTSADRGWYSRVRPARCAWQSAPDRATAEDMMRALVSAE